MGAEEIESLRRAYAAFQEQNTEKLSEELAHDVEFVLPESLPWGGTHHGHLGVTALMEIYDEHVEGRWADPDEYLEAGDRIVVLGRIKGRGRASGEPFEVPFAHVWGFRDGIASSFRAYFDSAPILAVLEGRG